MTPPKPKRAVFSLNVDSYVESLHQERFDPQHHHGTGRKSVLEAKGPTTGSTHFEIVKKGDTVEKSVEGFGLGEGEREGEDSRETYTELNHTTETTSGSGPRSVHTITTTTSTHTPTRNKRGSKSVDVDTQYDTSDL
ncbi:hypothetical protein K505DRAFT_367385 [Melanomma pulvis-pyrius CBS 109.77]|uniref:Uncharacterized protein n=1 Tax=Melanomma pulvis-pyrius CBS 109.77 TaxID=1314802 RepID=A0A6A6WTK1_9PLEO|nr:hypothetical protein K505DRAFT_367385 [Melanomma pulvis-pyrius CBS 109.77]